MSSYPRGVTSVILWTFLSSALTTTAQTVSVAGLTSKPKIVLVELFTSEGCSDCPPADELLRRVDRKQTSAGKLIVGVSEHVTYWNYLGWSDPFSLDKSDQRQNAYSNEFGLNGVYTPQMVVNGTEEFVGSDSAKLSAALQKEDRHPSAVDLRIASLDLAAGKVTVTFSADGVFPSQGVDVIAVLADDTDRSSVQRGENSGHTLTHVAVARSLTQVATLKGATTESTVQIPLPHFYQQTQMHHLILIAQTTGTGPVVGADTKSF
jgi:hypothetical protein